jgi:hypothetical protein
VRGGHGPGDRDGVVGAALRGAQLEAHRKEREDGRAQGEDPGPAQPVEGRADQQGGARVTVEDVAVHVEGLQRAQEEQRQRGQDRQRQGQPGKRTVSEREGAGQGQCADRGEGEQRARSRAADPRHLIRLACAEDGRGSQGDADPEGHQERGTTGRAREGRQVGGHGQYRELVQQTRGEQDRAVRRPGTGRTPVRRPHQQIRRPDDQRADQGVGATLLRVPLDRWEHREGEAGQQARARSGEAVAQQGQASGRRRGRQHRRKAQHQQRVRPLGQPEQGVQEEVVQTVHGVGVPQRRPQVGQRAPSHVVRHHLVPPHAAAAPDAPQAEGEGERGRDERVPGQTGCGHGSGRGGGQPDRP